MSEDEVIGALEKQLGKMRPASLGNSLTRDLERVMVDGPSVADRVLAGWVTMGAMAACVVAGITVWQLVASPVPATLTAQEVAIRQQAATEYQKMIASR